MSRTRALLRVARGAVLLVSSATALSCSHGVDPDYSNPEPAAPPYAGLYTPGSKIGAVPVEDAGAMEDPNGISVTLMMGGGDRCVGTSGQPGTPCMLMLNFSTIVIGEHWKPANVGAVWIERPDPGAPDDATKSVYVKTLERWADVRSRSLYVWGGRACQLWPEMDALSRATLADHNMPHSVTWDGKDLKGHIVPDGTYRLYVEVTETETTFGPLATFDFTKGKEAMTLEPPDTRAIKGLKLAYMPGG